MGARPPPKFIKNDQRTFGCLRNDPWGFRQLLHERAAPFVDAVRGSHPDEEKVYTWLFCMRVNLQSLIVALQWFIGLFNGYLEVFMLYNTELKLIQFKLQKTKYILFVEFKLQEGEWCTEIGIIRIVSVI